MSTPEQMAQAMIDNLPARTGRSLEAWLTLTRKLGAMKHGELVRWLKSEHGVTHGFANLIARETLQASAPSAADDDLLTAQYAGDKVALRPIHDAIIKAVTGFGADVEIAPKKTYVSLRRTKQFALIQPSTKSRVDIGINLKDHAPTERLEASGSFNAMVSHRVRLSSVKEVDKALIGWLRAAYDAAD